MISAISSAFVQVLADLLLSLIVKLSFNVLLLWKFTGKSSKAKIISWAHFMEFLHQLEEIKI